MAEKKLAKKVRVFTASNGSELELWSIVLAGNKVLYTVKPLKNGGFRLTTLAEIDDLKRAKLVDLFNQAHTQQ